MKLDRFNEVLLESVGVGLAILEPETRKVLFGNRRFVEWFPGVDKQQVLAVLDHEASSLRAETAP